MKSTVKLFHCAARYKCWRPPCGDYGEGVEGNGKA